MINQRLKLNVSIKERRNNMSESMYDLLFVVGVMSDCMLSTSITLGIIYLIIKRKE